MNSMTASVRLLTPEQFVKHIHAQFGVDLSKPFQGRSPALQRYLLPLGGLDHDTVYERDRQLKVQNLLAAQAIAWEAAQRIMLQEQKQKRMNVTPDHPDWSPLFEDFFLKIQSRPPTPGEIQFFELKARELMERQASPLQAWTAVVYALLASVEFWSL